MKFPPSVAAVETDTFISLRDEIIIKPRASTDGIGVERIQTDSISQAREFWRACMETVSSMGYVGWDVAVLPGGKLELIEGNHNPGMNIVQAPSKHGVRARFTSMLDDYYSGF